MSQRQRNLAREKARSPLPVVDCGRCGVPALAMPLRDALTAFEGDDFESWVVRDGLEQMQQFTGEDALVSMCEGCVCFTSVALDGRPFDFVIS